ncbi:hypothetical protein [Mycobacterium sp. 94-17]|uniref:hypothetical protein n=1 Tax=Mycobacterium sp. 94-17 TaxID=2986147 RepID=UPI002D1E521B|nr:hypothetical protein [Mycobacterium sp. 94-17]MEB4208758.1 hypothetical protein [Mycobacterium sp. 94-17]
MRAAERERRDANVVALFLAGGTYRSIARVVGLRSPQSVANIVQRAFAGPQLRRGLLTDEAFAIWQERAERLFRAHWSAALDGNHRSAELCRKLLAHMATVYGLGQEDVPDVSVERANDRREALAHIVEPVEDQLDALAQLRAARARAYE